MIANPDGDDFPLRELLRAAGVGVALFDAQGRLTTANDAFERISAHAPGAAWAIRQRALEAHRPVEDLRFDRKLGWLRWVAHPVDQGAVAIQVAKASDQEILTARLASQAGESAGMPNRAAMNADLLFSWGRCRALMVVEPRQPPRGLPMPQEKAQEAVTHAAAVVGARLLEDEGVYRLSPLTLAVLTSSAHRQLRLAGLLGAARAATEEVCPGLDLVGGCAAEEDAHTPTELWRSASQALLAKRLEPRGSPESGPGWHSNLTD